MINRNPLHVQVADALRERIVRGILRPSDRLNEVALCEDLDISRTPLREAIKILETEGLVTIKPHKGATVAEISLRDITEIFDLLAPLEALGTRFAMERMSDSDFAEISDLHDAMIACYRANDREGCFLRDYQFHNTMIRNAKHEVLRATHTSLTNRSQRGRYLAPRFSQEKLDEAMAAHEELIIAIRDRRVDAASAMMFDHVRRTGEFVVATLKLSDLVAA
jgi:DNA-binding GntR family transcriptional regulator